MFSPHLSPRPVAPAIDTPLLAWAPVERRQLRDRSDNREYERRPLHRDVWMIDVPLRSVLRCQVDDVSDTGLHATAPAGFDFAVGRRFEVRMAGPIAAHRTVSLGYATVVRTESNVGRSKQLRTGFALRFDAPRFIAD